MRKSYVSIAAMITAATLLAACAGGGASSKLKVGLVTQYHRQLSRNSVLKQGVNSPQLRDSMKDVLQ